MGEYTESEWNALVERTADEYESAAEYAAKNGGRLPMMLSGACFDAIRMDDSAFARRVNDYRYAIAMEGRP